MSNVTPITGSSSDAVAQAIEKQRERLFRAMNLVRTTALSCGEHDLDRRGTLDAAWDIINDVALKLNKISGWPGN